MKKNLYVLLAAFVFVSGIISCGNKKDKTGLLIPKDAIMVIHVNGASISSKLDWKEIAATNWFHKIYQQASNDSMSLQLLDNPEASGVDIKSDIVYFLRKTGNKGYLVAEGKIKDKAAFATFAGNMNKNMKPTVDNGMNSMSIGLKGALVWNDTHFAYVFDVPMPGDKFGALRKHPMEEGMPGIPSDSLKKLGKETLSLSNTETLGTDERFSSLIKQEGDIHFWVAPGKLYNNMMNPYMSMMKLGVLIEDNIGAMTVSFDNGKITLKSKQYYGKELSGLIKKYDAKAVDASLINRLPSQDVIGILAFNFPPQAIKDFLTLTGMEGLINLFMAKMNYSIDDFIKGNKGEVLFAITDFKMKTITDTLPSFDSPDGKKTKPQTYSQEKPDPKVFFATAINDKKAFERLVFLIESESSKRRKDSSKMTYKMNNDWFVASNTGADIDKFLAGGNSNLPIAKIISGEPVGGYLNLQQLLKAASLHATNKTNVSAYTGTDDYILKLKAKKDSTTQAALAASADMWQDIIMKGGVYRNGGVEFTVEVNLVNKTENSLKQLNRYINLLSTIYEKEMDKALKDVKDKHIEDEEVVMPPGSNN